MQKYFDTIRSLYNPIQPTVKQSGQNVTYREISPAHQLQSKIYCYWELKTTTTLNAPFLYRVVADGCIDIFFEMKNPAESYVMGFCKKYTEFPLENSFSYIGIRFLPTMFSQLFQVNALELSNHFQLVENVVPHISKYIGSRVERKHQLEDLALLFNQYFIDHLLKIKLNDDNRLYDAISLILKNDGIIQIENELDTGISGRQLRRLFQYYIGTTPKTFSKVVRFQNILRAKPSTQSLRENKLFFDAGYYDQAHFIKEFKNFYGVSPAKAFGR